MLVNVLLCVGPAVGPAVPTPHVHVAAAAAAAIPPHCQIPRWRNQVPVLPVGKLGVRLLGVGVLGVAPLLEVLPIAQLRVALHIVASLLAPGVLQTDVEWQQRGHN